MDAYEKSVQIQEWLGINERKLARALGTNSSNISLWRRKGVTPKPETRRQIELLHDLSERIYGGFPDKTERETWLNTAIPRHGGLTRLEIITARRSDLLAAEVDSLPVVKA